MWWFLFPRVLIYFFICILSLIFDYSLLDFIILFYFSYDVTLCVCLILLFLFFLVLYLFNYGMLLTSHISGIPDSCYCFRHFLILVVFSMLTVLVPRPKSRRTSKFHNAIIFCILVRVWATWMGLQRRIAKHYYRCLRFGRTIRIRDGKTSWLHCTNTWVKTNLVSQSLG